MKKQFFSAVFLLLIGGAVFAQEGAKVGFRASPLISWANVVDENTKTKDPNLNVKPALGFSFDFVFTYGFSESIGLRTGVNIARKGFNSDFTNVLGSELETNVKVTAIEIPLGLKFRSPEIGSGMYIVGHFGINPELNVANQVNSKLTVNGDVISETEQRDVDGYNFFTGSFVPGVGLDWEFDWGMLEFAATYHWGLLSLTDPDELGGAVSKMNYIALNLGYFF